MTRATPRAVIGPAELDWKQHDDGHSHAARHAALAPALGLSRLGARRVCVPPGKAAWPLHAHLANEEFYLILSGRGRYTLGDREHEVGPGDCLGAPAGPGHAHRLFNCGSEDLEYLVVSTMNEPDVTLYPERGCFGVFAGAAPGGDKAARSFEYFGDASGAQDYWQARKEQA